MALDAIAEVAVRAVGRLIVDLILTGIFYWPGWLFLRVLTLGRYPPSKATPHNREFVALFGLAVILLAVLICVQWY